MRLPGHRERFPRVDDHLVEPEVTRDEIVGGRKMEASPAKAPHAGQHGQLDLVVGSHIAPGYRLMVDLLTRHDVDSDFASDSAVVKEGIDPATGTRYLEEIAFEVVSEQNEQIVQAKTPGMIRRGVRRVFAIFVKRGAVEEWSATKGRCSSRVESKSGRHRFRHRIHEFAGGTQRRMRSRAGSPTQSASCPRTHHEPHK